MWNVPVRSWNKNGQTTDASRQAWASNPTDGHLRSRKNFNKPGWFMLFSKRTLGVSLLLAGMTLAAAALAQDRRLPWQKDPGPIAGRWSVTCEDMAGMVVEFGVDGKKATGRISRLGKAGVFGYSVGEDILRLEADSYGDWVGQLQWRGLGGSPRWDPIRFVATSTQLNATMTTDNCYKRMPRSN
jgi:hypothetical protein